MEQKANFARQQAAAVPFRLPPGFRFHPTDEELVLQYLRRKALDASLPTAVITEIDLLKFNPWDLLLSGEERYFFNLKEAKYVNGIRANRATSAGYWKATGKEKAVASSRVNQVVGTKRALVFYQGKAPSGQRTDWIMHEYRLAGAGLAPSRSPQANANACQEAVVPCDAWVVCRIFKKRRAAGKADCEMEEEEEQSEVEAPNGTVRYFHFLGHRHRDGTSPVSSCVTDLSEENCKGEETATSSRRVGSSTYLKLKGGE